MSTTTVDGHAASRCSRSRRKQFQTYMARIMDCGMTRRFSKQSKPNKRVTFKKEDRLVIIYPQYEDQNRVSIFELRSSKMAPNVSSRTSDYSTSAELKIERGDQASHSLADSVSEQLSRSRSAPLKSILKKKSCTSRVDGIRKVEQDSTGFNTPVNCGAIGLRGGSSGTKTSSRALDSSAVITGSAQDKSIYLRSQTGLSFTPGQKTDGQAAFVPLSSRNKRTTPMGCTTTTGRCTTANYSAQSSRSPAKQGSIHIIRPFSGVTYDVATTADRSRAESNCRSAVRTATVCPDRKLNVVGIPVSLSDLYPALQKLEKMTERTEKLYKNILAHSSVTTAGSESSRAPFRPDYAIGRADSSSLRRSYSSVHSSSESLWKPKRTSLNNSRTDYYSSGSNLGARRTALAWPPTRAGQLPRPSATRLGSGADLHKSPGHA